MLEYDFMSSFEPNLKGTLTEKNACHYLEITQDELEELIKRGLYHVKAGSKRLFSAESIDEWIYTNSKPETTSN